MPNHPNKRSLDNVDWSQRVRETLSQLNKRRKIKEVWTGGGGNDNGACQEMAMLWMSWVADALARGTTLEEIRRDEEDWVRIDWFGKKYGRS